MDQRVGMPMHLLPPRSVTAKDPGDTQRPVLLRQPADLAVLSFDGHQHDQIAGRVGRYHLQVRVTALKEALQGLEALGGGVDAAFRFSAERRHEGVVVAGLDQREVGAHVPPISIIGFWKYAASEAMVASEGMTN